MLRCGRLARHASTSVSSVPLQHGLNRLLTRSRASSGESLEIQEWHRIAQEARLVLVRWTVHRPLHWGECMGILGSSEGLGSWCRSPDSIVRMSWLQGDNWKADVWLPCGDVEYKYLVTSENGEFKEWQQVPQNKSISLFSEVLVYDVVDSWDSPDHVKLSTVAAPPMAHGSKQGEGAQRQQGRSVDAPDAPAPAPATVAQQQRRSPQDSDNWGDKRQGSNAEASGAGSGAMVSGSSSSKRGSGNSSSSSSSSSSNGSGMGAGSSGQSSSGNGLNRSSNTSSSSSSNDSGNVPRDNRYIRGNQMGKSGLPPRGLHHPQDQHQQHQHLSQGVRGGMLEGSSSAPGGRSNGLQASSSSSSSDNGGSPAVDSRNGWRGVREGIGGEDATNIGDSRYRSVVGGNSNSDVMGGAMLGAKSNVLAADTSRSSLSSRFQQAVLIPIQLCAW
ncbi:hypothetical protein DUNSADRAFT_14391 [Dunaliella salina]|uniref:CBM20 domain-containing protein n=1 Tax=Dunaliella salina TaxID=3046 RepID=A0ABQ7G7E5_DUNSA|nr:hypothetical protein DUNSADRAFT_14391 [Dunaliella salina]|eukprot:KAF5830521.1 hypothetical protein DUNSADRAFT_14391 [Dunaliella salina]